MDTCTFFAYFHINIQEPTLAVVTIYACMPFFYRQTLLKTDGLTVVFVSDTNLTLSKTGSDCK